MRSYLRTVTLNIQSDTDDDDDDSSTSTRNVDVNAGDYIVALRPAVEGEKADKPMPRVWKVTSRNRTTVTARLEDMPHIKPVERTIGVSKILANLGPDPVPGNVYGTDLTARYMGRKKIDADVTLHIFTKPSRENLESLLSGFRNVVRKRLEKLKLTGLLNENVVYELRPKNGKGVGYFYTSNNPDKPHRIVYCPEALKHYTAPHLIAHEFGHLIEWKLREYRSLWAAWQVIHAHTVYPDYVTAEDTTHLLTSCIAVRDEHAKADVPAKGATPTIRAWRASLEDDDRPKAAAVLRWLNQHRRVRPHDLETLLNLGKDDLIKKLWPSERIETKHSIKPLLTEYATESMSETFAEALALSFCGKKLPDTVQKLLDKTLTTLREAYANEGR